MTTVPESAGLQRLMILASPDIFDTLSEYLDALSLSIILSFVRTVDARMKDVYTFDRPSSYCERVFTRVLLRRAFDCRFVDEESFKEFTGFMNVCSLSVTGSCAMRALQLLHPSPILEIAVSVPDTVLLHDDGLRSALDAVMEHFGYEFCGDEEVVERMYQLVAPPDYHDPMRWAIRFTFNHCLSDISCLSKSTTSEACSISVQGFMMFFPAYAFRHETMTIRETWSSMYTISGADDWYGTTTESIQWKESERIRYPDWVDHYDICVRPEAANYPRAPEVIHPSISSLRRLIRPTSELVLLNIIMIRQTRKGYIEACVRGSRIDAVLAEYC